MDYAASLVSLVDQRIDQAQLKPTKMGTVEARETDTARCLVTFDGTSGIAQPVKCFESVVVDTGDRVGLIKYEGEWVITGNYTPRTWADEMVFFQFSSSTAITGSSFVDMPSSPTASFTKARDSTQLQIEMSLSLRSDTATSTIEVGALITFPDATTTDQVLFHRIILVTAGAHFDCHGGVTTALTLPAGPYGVTGRWRRSSGTGSPTIDSNDSITIHAKEVTG